MIITKFAFRQLLTFDEKVMIEKAKETSAELRVLDNDLMSADEIDLKSDSLAQGLGFLVSVGILTEERMGVILSVGKGDIPSESIVKQDEAPVIYPEKKYQLYKVTAMKNQYDESWAFMNAFPSGTTPSIEDKGDYFEITINGTLPPPAVDLTEEPEEPEGGIQ
jgi:hypothetical protein